MKRVGDIKNTLLLLKSFLEVLLLSYFIALSRKKIKSVDLYLPSFETANAVGEGRKKLSRRLSQVGNLRQSLRKFIFF